MNLAFRDLPTDEFRYNLKFLDKKRNMIMDGDFVKIVYSDEYMAINTIFFVTTLKLKHRTTPNDEPFGKHRTTPNDEPFGKHRTDQSMYLSEGPCCEKYTIWFSPYESNNQQSIPSLLEYEAVLLDEYRKQTGCTKEPLYFLKNQLLSGNLRVYRFYPFSSNGKHGVSLPERSLATQDPILHILVKISGIWESNDSFGITYKFIDYTAV